jgi:stage II sporulation protein D
MPRILLATLVALLTLVAPASAAKTTFTIKGAGFGHGVGMSQYGALGYAQNGWDAARILRHYYTGTSLGTTDPDQKVRVLLVPQTAAARISGVRQAGTRKLDPNKTYEVRRRALTEVELLTGGRRVAVFKAPLQVAGDQGVTTLGGHGAYRGVMEFKPGTFSGLAVTNVVGLDEYLQGVVPAESPASWPAEALRAQAIAARTYAITTAKSEDFDHYADTRSQVYKGVGIEQASTNAAVAATRGQVVTYQGQPVVTYFFSTSGGRTESVENTTLGREPRPWLVSVEDEYDHVSPRHRWTSKPSMASAKAKLGSLVKGSFKGIRVTKRGVSPRIVSAEVVGSRGRTVTDGATLRARLGLFDSWAYFTSISGEKDEPRDGDASGGTTAPPGVSAFLRPVGALRGTVIAEGRAVTVEALRDGRWVKAGATRARRSGAYRWAATTPGTYRAVVDGAHGPAVRIG